MSVGDRVPDDRVDLRRLVEATSIQLRSNGKSLTQSRPARARARLREVGACQCHPVIWVPFVELLENRSGAGNVAARLIGPREGLEVAGNSFQALRTARWPRRNLRGRRASFRGCAMPIRGRDRARSLCDRLQALDRQFRDLGSSAILRCSVNLLRRVARYAGAPLPQIRRPLLAGLGRRARRRASRAPSRIPGRDPPRVESAAEPPLRGSVRPMDSKLARQSLRNLPQCVRDSPLLPSRSPSLESLNSSLQTLRKRVSLLLSFHP